MTNGTTGFPVAPIAEEEAMKLSTMFSRAADAIVAASSMPKTIEELQGQVSRLSQDLEARTLHADELDRTIHELREQRDNAKSQRDLAENERDVLSRQLSQDARTIAEQGNKINDLTQSLQDTKRDRDDAHYKVLELEDELAKAKAALSDIQTKIAAFFPQATPKPVEQERIPEPFQSLADPELAPVELPKWEDMQSVKIEPAPLVTHEPLPPDSAEYGSGANLPAAAPDRHEPTRTYLDNWKPGASWDSAEGKYYVDR